MQALPHLCKPYYTFASPTTLLQASTTPLQALPHEIIRDKATLRYVWLQSAPKFILIPAEPGRSLCSRAHARHCLTHTYGRSLKQLSGSTQTLSTSPDMGAGKRPRHYAQGRGVRGTQGTPDQVTVPNLRYSALTSQGITIPKISKNYYGKAFDLLQQIIYIYPLASAIHPGLSKAGSLLQECILKYTLCCPQSLGLQDHSSQLQLPAPVPCLIPFLSPV